MSTQNQSNPKKDVKKGDDKKSSPKTSTGKTNPSMKKK